MLLFVLPFTVLAINFIYGNSNYRVPALQSGNVIKEELEKLDACGKKLILTDADFCGTHIIYNGFQEYANLTFYDLTKYDSLKNEELYLLINLERMQVPDFVKHKTGEWKIIFNEKKLLIYKNK